MHLKTTSFAALRLTSKTPICSLAEVMLKHIIGVVKPYAVTAVRFQINCEASRPFVSLDKQRSVRLPKIFIRLSTKSKVSTTQSLNCYLS